LRAGDAVNRGFVGGDKDADRRLGMKSPLETSN